MKAAINVCYGSPDVLEIREVPKPIPQAGEILIKVYATTVSRTDACALRAHPFFMRLFSGLLRPKKQILGLDFAGTIEAIGKGVTKFKEGDQIFGLTPKGYGGHAEYVCLPANGTFSLMPKGKLFQDVVVCEGAWYADTYLQAFKLKPNHKILIYGASCAIGSSALQLAKIYGAEVTAVVSTPHIELAKSLGADYAIDYTTNEFTKIDRRFDFVLDAVGKTSYFKCRSLLKQPNGVYAATDLGCYWQNIALAAWSSLMRDGRVLFPTPKHNQSLFERLKSYLESGTFRAVIDRKYLLQDIAEAYRYVETEKKTGMVVIDIAWE